MTSGDFLDSILRRAHYQELQRTAKTKLPSQQAPQQVPKPRSPYPFMQALESPGQQSTDFFPEITPEQPEPTPSSVALAQSVPATPKSEQYPEQPWWQSFAPVRVVLSALDTIMTPFTWLNDHADKPWAGAITLAAQRIFPGQQQLESEFDKAMESGANWYDALRTAYEKSDIPWYARLALESSNPIYFLPYGRALQPLARIGAINKAINLGTKAVHALPARVPGVPSVKTIGDLVAESAKSKVMASTWRTSDMLHSMLGVYTQMQSGYKAIPKIKLEAGGVLAKVAEMEAKRATNPLYALVDDILTGNLDATGLWRQMGVKSAYAKAEIVEALNSAAKSEAGMAIKGLDARFLRTAAEDIKNTDMIFSHLADKVRSHFAAKFGIPDIPPKLNLGKDLFNFWRSGVLFTPWYVMQQYTEDYIRMALSFTKPVTIGRFTLPVSYPDVKLIFGLNKAVAKYQDVMPFGIRNQLVPISLRQFNITSRSGAVQVFTNRAKALTDEVAKYTALHEAGTPGAKAALEYAQSELDFAKKYLANNDTYKLFGESMPYPQDLTKVSPIDPWEETHYGIGTKESSFERIAGVLFRPMEWWAKGLSKMSGADIAGIIPKEAHNLQRRILNTPRALAGHIDSNAKVAAWIHYYDKAKKVALKDVRDAGNTYFNEVNRWKPLLQATGMPEDEVAKLLDDLQYVNSIQGVEAIIGDHLTNVVPDIVNFMANSSMGELAWETVLPRILTDVVFGRKPDSVDPILAELRTIAMKSYQERLQLSADQVVMKSATLSTGRPMPSAEADNLAHIAKAASKVPEDLAKDFASTEKLMGDFFRSMGLEAPELTFADKMHHLSRAEHNLVQKSMLADLEFNLQQFFHDPKYGVNFPGQPKSYVEFRASVTRFMEDSARDWTKIREDTQQLTVSFIRTYLSHAAKTPELKAERVRLINEFSSALNKLEFDLPSGIKARFPELSSMITMIGPENMTNKDFWNFTREVNHTIHDRYLSSILQQYDLGKRVGDHSHFYRWWNEYLGDEAKLRDMMQKKLAGVLPDFNDSSKVNLVLNSPVDESAIHGWTTLNNPLSDFDPNKLNVFVTGDKLSDGLKNDIYDSISRLPMKLKPNVNLIVLDTKDIQGVITKRYAYMDSHEKGKYTIFLSSQAIKDAARGNRETLQHELAHSYFKRMAVEDPDYIRRFMKEVSEKSDITFTTGSWPRYWDIYTLQDTPSNRARFSKYSDPTSTYYITDHSFLMGINESKLINELFAQEMTRYLNAVNSNPFTKQAYEAAHKGGASSYMLNPPSPDILNWFLKEFPVQAPGTVSLDQKALALVNMRKSLGQAFEDNKLYFAKESIAHAKASEIALSAANGMMGDYESMTELDRVMTKVFPFWYFPSRSIPFYLRTGLEKPWTVAAINRYEQQSKSDPDKPESLWGYIKVPIPGDHAVYINPLRPFMGYQIVDTNAMAGKGQTPVEQGITASRMLGFGPNPFITNGLEVANRILSASGGPAITRGNPTPLFPQWSWLQSAIAASTGHYAPEPVSGLISGTEMPDWYQRNIEKQLAAKQSQLLQAGDTVGAAKYDLSTIKSGMQRGDEESTQIWKDALSQIGSYGLYSIVLPIAKFRTAQELQMRVSESSALKDIGFTDSQLKQIRDAGLNPWSYLNRQQRRAVNESHPEWLPFRYMTAIPVNPNETKILEHTDKFFSSLEAARRDYQPRLDSANEALRLRIIAPRQWREIFQDNQQKVASLSDFLLKEYPLALVTQERIDAYRTKYGRPIPSVHPEDMAVDIYNSIQPENDPETGAPDLDSFEYARDDFLAALPDTIRKYVESETIRSRTGSSIEAAYRADKLKMRPYRSITRNMMREFPAYKALMDEYYVAKIYEPSRAGLLYQMAAQYRTTANQRKMQLRTSNGEIEAMLYYWGHVSELINPNAVDYYVKLVERLR